LNKRFTVSFLYGITILLGAFLLFQVQPIMSKYILPYFGGSSAVWLAASMFFQFFLLLGYFYSHSIVKLNKKHQVLIHFFVLLFTFIALMISAINWSTAITPDIHSRIDISNNPIIEVIKLLFVAVALPYTVITTTSSLIQFWYGRIFEKSSPYSFYVFSNIGSMFALISYPFLIEPFWTIKTQANIWTIMTLIYILFMLIATAIFYFQDSSLKEPKGSLLRSVGSISKGRFTQWVLLSALASMTMLSATSFLTQEIANIPFLWVLPLFIYLFSFVL